MPTLVIHAPEYQEEQRDALSFSQTVAGGVGKGFAIASTIVPKVRPGCKVVVLCKDKRLRAEGVLRNLVWRGSTLTGMRRYDVYFDGVRRVPYTPEALNRQGVAVLDD